ncbi:hypothetical protein ACEWJU_24015, partial [Escherichia coli]
VLNATINTYEMVIYPIAFFVCLFGQMRLFRSASLDLPLYFQTPVIT